MHSQQNNIHVINSEVKKKERNEWRQERIKRQVDLGTGFWNETRKPDKIQYRSKRVIR